MAIEKYAFAGLALLAVAFAAFLVLGGSAHSTNENTNPAYEAPAQQSGTSAQSSSAASSGTQAGGTAAAPGAQAGSSGTAAATAGQAAAAPSGTQAAGTVQEVSLTATSRGYDKAEIRMKAGVPVHFSFTANGAGCCSYLIIDKVGVQLSSSGNTVDATFTPPTPGNYNYHCGMNMCRGVLVAE